MQSADSLSGFSDVTCPFVLEQRTVPSTYSLQQIQGYSGLALGEGSESRECSSAFPLAVRLHSTVITYRRYTTHNRTLWARDTQ